MCYDEEACHPEFIHNRHPEFIHNRHPEFISGSLMGQILKQAMYCVSTGGS